MCEAEPWPERDKATTTGICDRCQKRRPVRLISAPPTGGKLPGFAVKEGVRPVLEDAFWCCWTCHDRMVASIGPWKGLVKARRRAEPEPVQSSRSSGSVDGTGLPALK